jgi:hypothetical protein
LMPLLVCCFHSAATLGSYRVEHTLLYQGARVLRLPIVWLWMGVPAVITFLILLPFLRSPLWRRVVYIGLCLFWSIWIVAHV